MTETATGAVVYDKTLTTLGTATLDDAVTNDQSAADRRRRAVARQSEAAGRGALRRCPIAARSLLLVELERRAVHAIALAGRLRPVGKDVAEMAAALGAMHLGARHQEAAIGRGADARRASAPRTTASPMPLSYLVAESNNGSPQPAQRNVARALLVVAAGCVPARSVPCLRSTLVLQRIELLLPLGIALLDGIASRSGAHDASDAAMISVLDKGAQLGRRHRQHGEIERARRRQILLQEPVDAIERQLARLAPARQGRVGIGRAFGPAARRAEVSRSACRAASSSCTARAACAGHWPSRGSFCAAVARLASDSRSPRRK